MTDFSTFTGGFADRSLITEMTCFGNDIQRETGARGQRVPTSPVCLNSDKPAGTMGPQSDPYSRPDPASSKQLKVSASLSHSHW